jgi:hypothetical protein
MGLLKAVIFQTGFPSPANESKIDNCVVGTGN